MKYIFNISFILKLLRNEKNITQTELANATNIERSKISRIENNDTEPNIYEINTLCDYFGVSADYLLGRVDLTTRNNIIDNLAQIFNLSSKSKSIIKKFPYHHYNYSELNKYIENGDLENLIDIIERFFYFDDIAQSGLKELNELKKNGPDLTEEQYYYLMYVKDKIYRSVHISDLLLDFIRHDLIYLIKAFPHQDYSINYSKTNIDVMDDKQYTELLTSIIKERVNDI